MPFGSKKEQRVIQVESDAERRAKVLAEVSTNIDVIEKYADTFISINLDFWQRIASDRNIPDEVKLEFWKHSVSEFWETVRSGGIFTLSETMRYVGAMIRDTIMKALQERD